MIEIKNRFTDEVIYKSDTATTLGEACKEAITANADLSCADLRSANLSYANLSYTDLRSANLSYANLRSANLRSANLSYANLRSANLSYANLRSADLSCANLSYADLRNANLSCANLSDTNLRSADLSCADLRSADLRNAKKDFLETLTALKAEVPEFYKYLLDGRINGTQYSGECACLKGTFANIKNIECKTEILGTVVDADLPAEKLFLAIREGDTPQNNPVSAIVKDWTEEFCREQGITLPTREVIWK